MNTFEVTLPDMPEGQFRRSNIQWSLTILDEPSKKCRKHIISDTRTEELRKIVVNGIYYEYILFDFVNWRMVIRTNHPKSKAVWNIFNSLNIQTSLHSKAFYLPPRKHSHKKRD